MVQIAGLRGVLPDPSQLGAVVAAPGAGSRDVPLDVPRGLGAGLLTRDASRGIYRYHQVWSDPATGRTQVRKMVVCAVRLEPWSDGQIRPHEATPPAYRDARLAALRATRSSSAPVFAGYRDAATEVERLFRRIDGERPALEVTTADRTSHRVWRVHNAELFGQLRHLFAPKRLTVLDGHDRYEAMLAYRDELAAHRPLAMYSSANYALTCLVNLDDPALVIAARHRAIRGAPSSQAVLAAARPYFIIDRIAGAAGDLAKQRAALGDSIAHQPAFVAVWPGEPDAWKLTLSPDISLINLGIGVERALQKFDPVVVDQLFIARLMPGAVSEVVATAEGAFADAPDAVVIQRALTLDQINHVVDIGQVLPAGATAFTPPIAVGLVSDIIDPDEDVV